MIAILSLSCALFSQFVFSQNQNSRLAVQSARAELVSIEDNLDKQVTTSFRICLKDQNTGLMLARALVTIENYLALSTETKQFQMTDDSGCLSWAETFEGGHKKVVRVFELIPENTVPLVVGFVLEPSDSKNFLKKFLIQR